MLKKFWLILALTLLVPAAARAQVVSGPEILTAQDTEVLGWANTLAGEISATIEKWIVSKAITEEHLFAHFYFPIPGSDPTKFTTEYDAFADRDFQAPEEKALAHSSALVYATAADVNGYVPTHNLRFAMTLTGNRAVDLLNSRSKRIFGDRTGWTAGHNELPHILQRYQRDTGEVLYDLSVPVMVRGKHCGCVRIGYRRDLK